MTECRIKIGIGLLAPETALLHYKYSKQNTPEREVWSRELLQAAATRPTLLIKGPESFGPSLSVSASPLGFFY